MSSKPAEILVYEFLAAAKATAPDDSLLKTLELHDTIYQDIKTNQGVRVGETVSDFAPQPGGGLKEYDAEVPLAVFARVRGTQKSNRQQALQQAFELALAVAQLFFDDAALGGRVCDSLVLDGARGFDEMDAEPYAVVNFSLVVNPSGAIDFQRRRRSY